MSTWLKENTFVVAALALPVVVIVFFLAATAIPRFLVDDPRHDLLLAVEDYTARPGDLVLRFRVTEGRVFADARLNPAYHTSPTQRLYRFDASTEAVRRIAVEIPAQLQRQLQQELASRPASDRAAQPTVPPVGAPAAIDFPAGSFAVPETEGLIILDGPAAPDGYTFDNGYSGGRGLFGELFGMGSRRSNLRIAKNGRVIMLQLPHPDSSYRYRANANMLGWVQR